MRCYVTGDDSTLRSQLGKLLVDLGHDCPSTQQWPLDQAVSSLAAAAAALETTGRSSTAGGTPAASARSDTEIVFVLLAPDPNRALAVLRVIRHRTSNKLMAVGVTADTKLVLRAIREGADEFIDLADLKAEVQAALDRLQTSVTNGEVIAVLSASGGTGCSTLAVNLAAELSRRSQTCALLDLKLETGDLAPLLDLKPTYSIADLCQNIDRLDQSLLQGSMVPHECGIQLLAAPARVSDQPFVTEEGICQILSMACCHFPFVVADLGNSFRADRSRVLLQADVIVLVLTLGFTCLRNTRNALEFLKETGVPRNRVEMVVNRYGQPSEVSVGQAEEALVVELRQFIPDDSKSINRANNNGVPVVLQAPSAKVSRSIADLAKLLAEKYAPLHT